MNYNIVDIQSSSKVKASVLIIYTGGTFGMAANDRGALKPFNFEMVIDKLPELRSLDLGIRVVSFEEPIDSSNVKLDDWKALASIVEKNYDHYDGFVVLHGTDTMAYSASALSFMLQGLSKPVIFTGAQIPIGSTRSDARENLITALEIASMKVDGKPKVSEVCIYFNFVLLRANRSQKVNSSTFSAFHSENYPPLAESGITIEYNESALVSKNDKPLTIIKEFDPNVVILKLFPSIQPAVTRSILQIENLRGVILETYGSGNTMTDPWFLEALGEAIGSGVIVVNVSQCIGGTVQLGKYGTSVPLVELGVISGRDMTTESALTKLMLLLGSESSIKEVTRKMTIPMNGEMDD